MRSDCAGDIKADGEVEILNPDLHICTLGPDATFNMEITMNHGRGYVSSDKNKTPRLPIGTIAVDSIYTPVYKVNYTVENTRVGNMTDYDKLTLEVWTDSTISARDAVSLWREDPVRPSESCSPTSPRRSPASRRWPKRRKRTATRCSS